MYGEPDVLVHRGLATKYRKAVSVRYSTREPWKERVYRQLAYIQPASRLMRLRNQPGASHAMSYDPPVMGWVKIQIRLC